MNYVDAMWRMLKLGKADDFVIATGQTHSLEYFVERVFSHFGLNWHDWGLVDRGLFRPSDIKESLGNLAKTRENL